MKKTTASIITGLTLAIVGCSYTPPETVVERKWKVDPETGNYEEKETHTTTIYTNKEKDQPELNLPKPRNSNKK
ncbi:hypothetical protein [Thalassotalea fusca]